MSPLIIALVLTLPVLAYRFLIRFLEDRYCAAGDIDEAGRPRRGGKLSGRVVVVGASIQGLLAARICAAHYEDVLLVDAEHCSTDPAVKRTRVKQHTQLHLLLAILTPSFRSLFGNWDDELAKAGGSYAPPRPNGFRGNGFMKLPERDWGVQQLYIGREALEALLRRLVLALSPVEAEVGTVTRLVPSADRKTVEAVVIRSPDGTTRQVPAALVIDASGTTNGSLNWLRKERYPEPIKQIYDPRIRYNCFTWQLMPATIAKFDALRSFPWKWSETGHLGSAFIGNHASSFIKIDGDRVRSLYQTILDDGGEPRDTDELREAIHQEPYKPESLDALDVVWNAEREDGAPPPTCHNVPIGVCYKVVYDPRTTPSNLVPMGDTILRVNPIFGQGCTKAMIDALTLDRVLRRTTSGSLSTLSKRYLDLHYARTDGMWLATRSHDYGLETTVPYSEETLEWGHWRRRLGKWMLIAGQKDSRIGAYMTETTGQLRSSLALYYPAFLLRCAAVHLGVVAS